MTNFHSKKDRNIHFRSFTGLSRISLLLFGPLYFIVKLNIRHTIILSTLLWIMVSLKLPLSIVFVFLILPYLFYLPEINYNCYKRRGFEVVDKEKDKQEETFVGGFVF